MNSRKTVEMNEKSRKNHGVMLTKLLLSHLLIAPAYQTIYQIYAISMVFNSMVRYAYYGQICRYADYLIYIFIMEKLEIKENLRKNKGIYLQNYPSLS